MAAQTRTTTDHDEIRRWVEHHDGHPASARGVASAGAARVLRIDFPGAAARSEELDLIDWDEWFERFDDSGLALIYQEQGASGERGTSFRLVRR